MNAQSVQPVVIQRFWLVAFMATIALLASCWAAGPALAAQQLTTATLDPQQIILGQSTTLTVTLTGSQPQQFNMPQVEGLEFGMIGQSHRVEIMNGAILTSTSLIIRVTPQTAGIFTIPGLTPQSQPLILRVGPDNGSGATGTARSSTVPGALLGTPNAEGIRMAADGAAFVRLVLPKRDVFVGESVPVEIEVGAREGFARPNGLPTLTSSEFTLNNLTRSPENSQRVIDGKPYTVFTWHSEIAAVKPGKFTLSLDVPFTVRIRTRPSRDTAIEDALGDPFMQNFFGATIQKDITVASPSSDLTVLSLPIEDQPKDFTGAVGQFSIASDVSATTAAAGDPLTLRMHVTGTGNFDRVDSPMLEHLDGWKTYPPKSSFKGSEATGKGEKTFEQPIIASKPGVQTLPGLAFSYFNPTTKHYETARSAPLGVTISPSLADSSLSAPQAPATAPDAHRAAAAPPTVGLRPDHAAEGGEVNTLVPLYAQPRFLTIPALLALGFTGVWFALRRAAGPRTRSQYTDSKAINRVLQELQAASRARDATLFFNIARSALTGSLASRWQLAPEDVTLDEVDARLGSEGAEIREILALADEANYSGHEMTSTDFQRWMQIVRGQLMEAPPA
jgi:BatD DUF11 like domain